MRGIAPFLLCVSACAADSTMLVVHKGDSSLGFYDMDGNLKDRVKLNQHPHEMVLSADKRFAYITENGTMRIENPGTGGNSVAIVDLKARKKVGSISTGTFRRPHGIAIDDKTGRLLVTAEAPDQVLLIDPAARRILKTYPSSGRTTHMVSFAIDGLRAFASNSGSGTVSAVRLRDGSTDIIETGSRPEGSVVSEEGDEMFVCNRESNTISVIEVFQRYVAAQIKTGDGPVRIALTPDGLTLVYALMREGAVGFADVITRTEIARVKVEGQPVSLNLSSDGTLAYAASEEIDMVHVVDVKTRTLVKSIKLTKGFGPDPVMSIP